MEAARTIEEVRRFVATHRQKGARVALVPTMGNLHDGHLSLVKHAKSVADVTIASIFVNPFQFGAGEDFDTYPRTYEADYEGLLKVGCDGLFMPAGNDVYPQGPEGVTRVEVPEVGTILCGASRPVFFRGVSTVVTIFFNMVQPDVAVFGRKDYQQLVIIRRMVRDLHLPIEIVGVPTIRDADGLAMSSRNSYLTSAERARAPALYNALCTARDLLAVGERDVDKLIEQGNRQLAEAGFRPDYFAVRRASDLADLQPDTTELVLLAAAKLGKARLIDNVELTLSEPLGRLVT